MNRTPKTKAFLFLMALLLLALPLHGCGQEASQAQVTFGFLDDLTGRAALGVKGTYDGLMAYLSMARETGLLKEIDIEVYTYDTKGEASRMSPGYLSLKGKGIQACWASPHHAEIIRTQFEEDEIPFLCGSGMFNLLDSDWYFSVYGTPGSQMEIMMQWIMETWDYNDGAPRVGAVSLSGIPYYTEQVQMIESFIDLHPDKFDWAGARMAPTTTTTWAGEVGRLLDCDYIFAITSGPPLASFTSEARERGYTGRFLGPFETYLCFWDLVKGAVPAAYLDGILAGNYEPWWDDDVEFIQELRDYTEKVVSASEFQRLVKTEPYRITGWALGTLLVDAVNRAAAKAGAANIDGAALRQAIAETDLEPDGWGNPWRIEEGINCFAYTARIYEYDADQETWVGISDWARPPSLGG